MRQQKFFTLNMWEDIFCGKQAAVVFMNPDSQLGLKPGWWWWPWHIVKARKLFALKGSEFLLWMNYMTPARLKQLLSSTLYIYWDTWKAAVINQVGFHIPRSTTWLLRFWISFAPCEVLPNHHVRFYPPLSNTKLQMYNRKNSRSANKCKGQL